MSCELVVCGIPFGKPVEQQALRQVKELGFTSVQIYTFWRDFEPAARGRFDWSALDRQVRLIQDAGLKFVPFLLLGPKYAAPDWWVKDPAHVGLCCLEHDKHSDIESIWNPAFRAEIRRALQAFAEHYLPWNVIESIQPGICGDYGEAIFPALGNWPGDYHTHRGMWCGGDDAAVSFRGWLQKQYGTVDSLNRAWRSGHRSFDEIRPFPKHRTPSRTAWFDLITWYRQSMTDYAEFWMEQCRQIFPTLPCYLCTGGEDSDVEMGALFAAQAKVAAKHGGGLRLTNEQNKFDDNFALTAHTQAACRFYGAYLGLEPVGPMTERGVRVRVFSSAAFGNRQMFHYYSNVIDAEGAPRPAAASLQRYGHLLAERPVEPGIALFWPEDDATFENAMPPQLRNALTHIRRHYPVSPVSEEMILDGALREYRCLLMIGARSARAGVLRAIGKWVSNNGGLLLATGLCRDLELQPVPEFDALFGIHGDSEDAWGHNDEHVHAPADFPRLGAIPTIHTERGWMNLAPGTQQLAIAKPSGQGGSQGRPVSAIFRRAHSGGGQAIFYCGPVSFQVDPEALMADPGIFMALLDDVCAQSGVKPLGTRAGEVARARVGGRVLVCHEDRIEAVPC